MVNESLLPAGFGENDIIFECPRCSKSLGIDERGAGLVVRCPDCGLRMQVPVPEDRGEPELQAGNMGVADYTRADFAKLGTALPEVERVEYSDDDVLDRKRQLEKMRIDYLARFERIREEIALFQAGVDRMVDILQDVAEESPAAER